MASVRVTLLRPRTGDEEELLEALQQLDNYLGASAGLLMSMVLRDSGGAVGRMAVWESAATANGEAVTHHVLALRSRIQGLAEEVLVDNLLDAASGWATGVPVGAEPAA